MTYYKWSTEEVRYLKGENSDLRRAVSEQTLEVIRLKKSLGILA